MLITGLLCFTTAVMAQTELKPKLIITTGTAFGVAPDGLCNNYNPKIGLGVGVEADGPLAGIRFHLGYNAFAVDRNGDNSGPVDFSGGNLSYMTLMADGVIHGNKSDRKPYPFILAGAGYVHFHRGSYNASAGGVTISTNSDNKGYFGFELGAGLEVPISEKVGFHIEGTYLNVAADNKNHAMIPVKAGLTFAL